MTAVAERRPLADKHALAPLLERSLVFVTGKGGAGKTTAAVALGLSAAARGRRTVVCDLVGSDMLTRAYAQVPAGHPVRLEERLWSVSVEPQAALEEWLRRQPGGAAAVAVLTRSHAFAQFVAAAPGAKELVTIGKAVDLARDGYDVVVADGPSTGHALGMLGAPRTVGEVAPLGSVGAQARELRDFLGDAERAAYIGVALPEELAVAEVLQLEDELPGATGRPLDLIVVNGVYPDRFTDEEAELLGSVRRDRDVSAIDAALRQHRRARLHAERVEQLRSEAAAPVVTLPYLFVRRLGPAEYAALSRVVA